MFNQIKENLNFSQIEKDLKELNLKTARKNLIVNIDPDLIWDSLEKEWQFYFECYNDTIRKLQPIFQGEQDKEKAKEKLNRIIKISNEQIKALEKYYNKKICLF